MKIGDAMTQKYSDIEDNIRKYITKCLGQQATHSTSLVADATYTKYKAKIVAGVLQIDMPTVPDAPTNLTITVDSTSLTLTWTSPPDPTDAPVTGFKIYKDDVLIATIGVLTTYNDTSVDIFEHYSYYVKAINLIGDSVASSTITGGLDYTYVDFDQEDTDPAINEEDYENYVDFDEV